MQHGLILEYLCDLTRTYGTTTLTDSEAQTCVQSYSVDELYSDLYVITRHYHLNTCWECDLTCAVHCAEIELWTILVSEWSVTTTLFLLQNDQRYHQPDPRQGSYGTSQHLLQ